MLKCTFSLRLFHLHHLTLLGIASGESWEPAGGLCQMSLLDMKNQDSDSMFHLFCCAYFLMLIDNDLAVLFSSHLKLML